jgi:hypothetical protein
VLRSDLRRFCASSARWVSGERAEVTLGHFDDHICQVRPVEPAKSICRTRGELMVFPNTESGERSATIWA